MSYRPLADFLETLQELGQLVRVPAEVSGDLEIAAITARVAQARGPAIFFERVAGGRAPMVTNLLGTRERIDLALGTGGLDAAVRRLTGALEANESGGGWLDKLNPAPSIRDAQRYAPKSVPSGPCQQIVRLASDVDLTDWPLLRCWSLEPSPALTAGIVWTRDPESGAHALEQFTLPLLGRDRLGIPWHRHHLGHDLWQRRRAADERLPVAIVLGGDPVWPLAAASPWGIDGCRWAGFLRGQLPQLVRCRSIELEVPIDADLVIEGYVDPNEEPHPVGPLAGNAGMYTMPGTAAVMHVTALTHRSNPVMPARVAGTPPHEPAALGAAADQLWLPVARRAVPELVDLDHPEPTGGRSFVVASIRKRYAGQPRQVAAALWGLHPTRFAKMLIVVDHTIDVRDLDAVLGHVATAVEPGRDVFFHANPAHPSDHAAAGAPLARAMGIDATAKFAEEQPHGWPDAMTEDEETRELVALRWAEYGLPDSAR